MRMLRALVIGVGRMGRWHAYKYAAHPKSQLVGVFDLDKVRTQQVAEELNTQAFFDMETALQARLDVVSVATPASAHFEGVWSCLQRGIAVLVEKPVSTTFQEAQKLCLLAHTKNVIFQVGHIERFHPIFQRAQKLGLGAHVILSIEAIREGPKPLDNRCQDVSVVYDLMIHDVDLALYLIRLRGGDIEKNNVKYGLDKTSQIDFDKVKVQGYFEIEGLTQKESWSVIFRANRVAQKIRREWLVVQQEPQGLVTYKLDFAQHRLQMFRGQSTDKAACFYNKTIENQDVLYTEISVFLESVLKNQNLGICAKEGAHNLQYLEWML